MTAFRAGTGADWTPAVQPRSRPDHGRPDRADLTMTAPSSGGQASSSPRCVDLLGQLDMAVAEWFAGPTSATESREDAYLLATAPDGLSVKIRADSDLQVKVFGGSPGMPIFRRARGHMQHWQNLFRSGPLSLNFVLPRDGWKRSAKAADQSPSLTGGRDHAHPRAAGRSGEAGARSCPRRGRAPGAGRSR